MNTAVFWCLLAACLAGAVAVAFAGCVVVLNRRVTSLAEDLAEVDPERPCPDRRRIAALESFATGPQGPPRGRHGLRPRGVPPPPRRRRHAAEPELAPDREQTGLLTGPRPPSWPPR